MAVPARCFAFLIASASALAAAQAADPCATSPQTCATLINTHATAESRLPSTVADISVAITATAKDMAAVQRQLAGKSASLLAYLRAEQVERLVTESVSFSPQTKYSENSVDKTVGYDGSARVSFRARQDKAPEILSGVLEHGANTISSTAFTPTEEEIAAAERMLSEQATRSAMTQADAIAKAAGLHVVSARTIDVQTNNGDNGGNFAPRAGMMLKMSAPMPPVETAAGERVLSMRADITVAAAR